MLLAEQPRLWDRLCEESGAFGRIPDSPSDMQHNRFAEGVFREALRLYPPVLSTIRKTTEPMEYDGLHIPTGTIHGHYMGEGPVIAVARDARIIEPDSPAEREIFE